MRVPTGVINPTLPLLFILLGLCVLPGTAAAVGSTQQAGLITETAPGEQATESNTTVEITGVTVNESVFRAGETALIWRSGPNGSTATEHRIDVALSAGVPDDHAVCLGSNACQPVPNQTGGKTVSFTNVDGSANRTTINVTLRRAVDGETVDDATLSVWRVTREDDIDRDGVSNEREVAAGSSLVLSDTDDDGLTDDRELELGADPTVADTDGDGLDDAREAELGTDPSAVDSDGDGLDDAREVDLDTDPTAADTDGDGLEDGREIALNANPTVADTDGDGLVDGREVALDANLTAADTDGDGLKDGREADLGADPTVTDTDGDGLNDVREAELGTDPAAVDSDGDGLDDAREVDLDTDPMAADTDDDGLADGRELELGADPTVADTDGDGLEDGRETELGTDPTVADTDGDYLTDGTEKQFGFNPTNKYTPALYGSGIVGFLLGISVAVSAIETGPAALLHSAAPAILGRHTTADGSTETGDPARKPVRADPDDHGDPSESADSTARDVFEQHQDALATDAERTLRMLEAESGQMKQSDIVESTSWSKAKVSRLLSSMDDDDAIVKVSIGRENLICLPEQTPEPAQPTDPGTVRSARLVNPATSG